jgi:hypothetical protein
MVGYLKVRHLDLSSHYQPSLAHEDFEVAFVIVPFEPGLLAWTAAARPQEDREFPYPKGRDG